MSTFNPMFCKVCGQNNAVLKTDKAGRMLCPACLRNSALPPAAEAPAVPELPPTTYVLATEGGQYSEDRIWSFPGWDDDAMRAYATQAVQQALAAAPKADSTEPKVEDSAAYRYACTLAQAIFDSEYASDPDYASGKVKWGLCDTTAGVLTQIDNMVSGMKRVKLADSTPAADEASDEMCAAMVKAMFEHPSYTAPWEDVMRLCYRAAVALRRTASDDGKGAEHG